MSLLIAFLALVIERLASYPTILLKAVGHPVIWISVLIDLLDRKWNHPELTPQKRRRNGINAVVLVVVATVLVTGLITVALSPIPLGFILLALLASSLFAQRSLRLHVDHVAEALEIGGVAAGRAAVAKIVGRDPDRLDEPGIARAAIESLAENFSDGVAAPAFWTVLGGLPGGAAYKAVNTADSMIGHRSEKYTEFGWAAARLDDWINLPASRLSALLIIAAAALLPGASASAAWAVMLRDARRHRSPNAGWPEAAMAGALGLALAGPRIYDGVEIDDAVMGVGGRRGATPQDIRRALRIYFVADLLLIALVGLLALFLLA